MTNSQRLGNLWHRFSGFVGIFLLLVAAGASGAAAMYWLDKGERMQLVQRFPVVRAEERAACTREFEGQIASLKQLNAQSANSLADLKNQMADTHEVVAYTLRFLGDRAKVNDARTAALLAQTRAAASAAATAAQKTAAVEQKVDVAAVKIDEAASTAKAVDRRLDTATRPPLPAKPWIGNYR